MERICELIDSIMKNRNKNANITTKIANNMEYDFDRNYVLRINSFVNYNIIYLFKIYAKTYDYKIYGIEYEKFFISDFDNTISRCKKEMHLNELDKELSNQLIGQTIENIEK